VLWDRKLPKSPYGDATVTNDLVFTTTLDGKVIAFNRRTGATVWQKQLRAGTNSAVAVNGNTLTTVASFPQGNGQKPENRCLLAQRTRGRAEDAGATHLQLRVLVQRRRSAVEHQRHPLIQPGQTAKLAITFTKGGKFPYLCTVPGHAEAGMKGVFTVG
jgi:uncharacterized cupredoxin-like copper-binding protein